MALPLGKKTLPLIERKCEAVRRLPELATTLEWVLRLEEPPAATLSDCPPLRDVLRAYHPRLLDGERALAAAAVRDRLVHAVPALPVPSRAEVEQAASDLRDELVHAAGGGPAAARQALEDRFREVTAEGALSGTGPQRAATALWRIEVLSGRRAPFSDTAVDPLEMAARLDRHHALITGVSLRSARQWMECADSAAPDQEGVLRELLDGCAELAHFDAVWRIDPGVAPLAAIRLEPDLAARIRMLATAVEHMLAWLPPVDETTSARYVERLGRGESGAALGAMLDEREYLFRDAEQVQWALDVRRRLMRVVAGAPPLRVEEVERAETILWHAAYELRPQCHYEHAVKLSRWPQAVSRARTVNEIRTWRQPRARIAALGRRLEFLAETWHHTDPGLWVAAPEGQTAPDACALLEQHPKWAQQAAAGGPLAQAVDLARQIDRDPWEGDRLAEAPLCEQAEACLRDCAGQLERELHLTSVPKPRAPVREPARRKEPEAQQAPAGRPAPAPPPTSEPVESVRTPQDAGLIKKLFKSVFGA